MLTSINGLNSVLPESISGGLFIFEILIEQYGWAVPG